jgi:hypothetical protein
MNVALRCFIDPTYDAKHTAPEQYHRSNIELAQQQQQSGNTGPELSRGESETAQEELVSHSHGEK